MARKKRSLTIGRGWLYQPVRLNTDSLGITRISNIIEQQRHSMNLTQVALAREAGVCAATISRFETHKTKSPHFRTVVDLLNALGFDVTSHARQATQYRAS